MDEQATEAVESLPTESEVTDIDTDTPAPATEGALDPAQAQEVAEGSEGEEGKPEPGPIPYSRFKEVNDQLRELKARQEQEQSVLQAFGFQSLEEMQQAALAEAQRAEEQRIAAYFAQQVEDGELDEDTAARARDIELRALALSRQEQQVQQILLRQERDAALSAHPAAQEAADMVDDLIATGVPPKKAAAYAASMVERFQLAAKAAAVVQKSASPPPPMGSDNQASQPVRTMTPREALQSVASISWRKLLAGDDTL